MPLYTYKCKCGERKEAFNHIEDRDSEKCDCGCDMELVITPTQINRYFLGSTDNPGYKCPVTNKYVTSKAQRQRIMKENDLTEVR